MAKRYSGSLTVRVSLLDGSFAETWYSARVSIDGRNVWSGRVGFGIHSLPPGAAYDSPAAYDSAAASALAFAADEVGSLVSDSADCDDTGFAVSRKPL